MGVIQLPDELQRVIERQVAEGRATDATAFLEEAVRHLLGEFQAEEDALLGAATAGAADLAAGRYTLVATPDDEARVKDGMMARLQARLDTTT